MIAFLHAVVECIVAAEETGTATTVPPFRAEQVGSLLRPPELLQARARARAGALSPIQLREIEDRCIRAALSRQESLGLPVVTDGEFRRDFWHLDFLRQLDGVGVAPVAGVKFDAEDVPPMPTVTGRVRCSGPIMTDHFAFLKSIATAVPKFTLPAPAMLHLRGGRRAISREPYPDLAELWVDAAAAYRVAIAHLAAAGCRYLQLDDVSFAYLCDPRIREALRAAGDDPAVLPRTYANAIDQSLVGRPAGLTVTMHTCRGNFRSTWLAAGPYESAVVEAMFSTDVDAYFMEWDSERAGGFEPLRLLPSTKKVVLGLVTTKSAALESPDTLARRIDEAARHVPLDRLALSPQCGFASTHHGNTLTEEDQWKKLARVVEVARLVWGA
jgi:5-methyltetrahydropteroyltriglutamate--homocysteine methyltransferase